MMATWKLKFILLVIISVPAFSGFPVTRLDREVLSGITYGWVSYFFIANAAVLIITGRRFFINIIGASALITMPVVFVGGMVSFFIFLVGLGHESGQQAYSPHYVSLCMTMLTVIPLALGMVGSVPFHRFEHTLLQKQHGVSKMEKFLLMFLRVFNHIVYFVIPNILESIREEGRYRRWANDALISPSELKKPLAIKRQFIRLIRDMIQLGVEGICASIQYIPLWAVEISQLPNKKH